MSNSYEIKQSFIRAVFWLIEHCKRLDVQGTQKSMLEYFINTMRYELSRLRDIDKEIDTILEDLSKMSNVKL